MAKPLTLENALALLKTQLAGGSKISDEARDLIAQKTAGRAVLHMTGSVLDVAETLSAIEFCNEAGETSGGDGCKTLSEVLAKPSGLPACGITGRALRGNKTTTTPVIDYTNMIDLYRETLAYAADAGKIGTDLHAAEMAVYQIQVKPTPPPPWPGLVKEWTTIRDAQDPTPGQAAQKARVLSRLRFNKAAAPTPTPAPVSGMDLGRDMGTVVTEVERPIPRTIETVPLTAPRPASPMPTPTVGAGGAYVPHVVMLWADSSPKDWNLAQDLVKQMAPFQRGENRITLWTPDMIAGGGTRRDVLFSNLNRADVFVYLLSADFTSGEVVGVPGLHETMVGQFPSKYHIPVVLRACTVPNSLIGKGGYMTPVAAASDRDSAFSQIAMMIRRSTMDLIRKH